MVLNALEITLRIVRNMNASYEKRNPMSVRRYYLQEVADLVGRHRNTILSWLKAGKIPEVNRDANGWRFWTEEDLQKVYEYATKVLPPSRNKRK